MARVGLPGARQPARHDVVPVSDNLDVVAGGGDWQDGGQQGEGDRLHGGSPEWQRRAALGMPRDKRRSGRRPDAWRASWPATRSPEGRVDGNAPGAIQ